MFRAQKTPTDNKTITLQEALQEIENLNKQLKDEKAARNDAKLDQLHAESMYRRAGEAAVRATNKLEALELVNSQLTAANTALSASVNALSAAFETLKA